MADTNICSAVRIIDRASQACQRRRADSPGHASPGAHSIQRAGTPIGPLNMLIAARAIARKLTLVSDNRKEFGRVPRLATEKWARS